MIKEPLENDIPRHQKRRGKRDRPFVIERRYTGPVSAHSFVERFLKEWRDWKAYKRFETLRQAEDSLAAMSRPGVSWHRRFEYRLAEPVA